MLHRLAYGTTTIEYKLLYSQRKTLIIHVRPDLSVTVEAPEGSDLTLVEEKVRKRAAWILKQQRELALYSFEQPPRQYVSGETHRYLGRQYRLKVMQSATSRESVRMSRGQYSYPHCQDHKSTKISSKNRSMILSGSVNLSRYTIVQTLVRAVMIVEPEVVMQPDG